MPTPTVHDLLEDIRHWMETNGLSQRLIDTLRCHARFRVEVVPGLQGREQASAQYLLGDETLQLDASAVDSEGHVQPGFISTVVHELFHAYADQAFTPVRDRLRLRGPLEELAEREGLRSVIDRTLGADELVGNYIQRVVPAIETLQCLATSGTYTTEAEIRRYMQDYVFGFNVRRIELGQYGYGTQEIPYDVAARVVKRLFGLDPDPANWPERSKFWPRELEIRKVQPYFREILAGRPTAGRVPLQLVWTVPSRVRDDRIEVKGRYLIRREAELVQYLIDEISACVDFHFRGHRGWVTDAHGYGTGRALGGPCPACRGY